MRRTAVREDIDTIAVKPTRDTASHVQENQKTHFTCPMVDSPIVVNTPIVPQIRAIQVTIVTCAAQTQTRLTPVRARNARKTADRDRIVRNAELCTWCSSGIRARSARISIFLFFTYSLVSLTSHS